MHRRALRVLAALSLCAALSAVFLSLLGQRTDAAPEAIQKFDPSQCQDGDKSCIASWYKEYAAQILGEAKYYAKQEDFLAEMLAQPEESLITAKSSLLLIEGGVAYTQWVPLKDEAVAASAGLDMPRYRAIIGVCREAVSGMRQTLFDLRQHREAVRGEAAQYVKNAVACEHAFNIATAGSELRGTRRPAKAPRSAEPDSDAPDAPMDIRPAPGRP